MESSSRQSRLKAAQTSGSSSKTSERKTPDSFDTDMRQFQEKMNQITANLNRINMDFGTPKAKIPSIPPKQHQKISKRLNELRHSKADLKQAETYLPRALYCRDCGVSRDAIRKGTTSDTDCMLHPPIARYGTGECRNCHKVLKASPPPPPCTPASQFHRFVDASEEARDLSEASIFKRRDIIVIACKTVDKKTLGDAIVHLTAIDFLTGDVLVDIPILVQEEEDVVDWRTEETGVSAATMAKLRSWAMADSFQKPGWVKAKEELERWADRNTLFVGFSVQRTLASLRLKTDKIVDFQILYGKRFKKQVITFHQACQTFLKLPVRKGGKRNLLSTCLEDAVAARDLLMHWIDMDGNVRRVNVSSEEEREMKAIVAEEDERFAKAESKFGSRSSWCSDVQYEKYGYEIDPHDEEEAEEEWKFNRQIGIWNQRAHYDRGRYAGGF